MDQKHAGLNFMGKKIWHTKENGNWWAGWIPEEVTSEELYYVCMTTIIDLLRVDEELAMKVASTLKK